MANPALSASTAARGLKRVCTSCGIRFYDLNKRPIACPNCGTEFSGEIKLKGRRTRVAAESPVVEKNVRVPVSGEEIEDDQDIAIEGDAETLSLDEVEDMEKEGTEEEDIDLEAANLEDLEDIEALEEEDVEEDLDVADDKE